MKVIENVGKQPRARSSFKPRENTHHAEDLINTRLSTITSLSCRDQEGRRGSDEVVLGTSGFPSSETGMSGNFWTDTKN